jgi:hypothetical protein
MGKVIGRFDPTPSRSAEECERHYTQVHLRMAQDLLRPMPSLLSYHVNRALVQADVTGGWAQRPRAWRFVVLRFTPGETLVFTPEQNEMVAQDHVNCPYRLRSCDVDETVLLHRVGGQLALAKFLVEADRPPSVDPERAWSAFDELAGRVRAAMDGAFGARALIVNRVLTRSSASRSTLRVSGRSASWGRRHAWGTSRRISITGAGVRRRSGLWRTAARSGIQTSSTSTSCRWRRLRRSTCGSAPSAARRSGHPFPRLGWTIVRRSRTRRRSAGRCR